MFHPMIEAMNRAPCRGGLHCEDTTAEIVVGIRPIEIYMTVNQYLVTLLLFGLFLLTRLWHLALRYLVSCCDMVIVFGVFGLHSADQI